MIPGSEFQSPTMPAFLWTVFFGVLLIRREMQLRGGGPTGRARWLLFAGLGLMATFYWLMLTGTNVRSLVSLRGGSSEAQDGKPPAAVEETGDDNNEAVFLIPNEKLGGFFIVKKPLIRCPECNKTDNEGITWQPAGEYSSWRDFVVLKAIEDPAKRELADRNRKVRPWPDAARSQRAPAAPGQGSRRKSKVDRSFKPPPTFGSLQSAEKQPFKSFGYDPKVGYGRQGPPERKRKFEGANRHTGIAAMLAKMDASAIKPESLTYTLFFTYLPGMCMSGYTERREPCKKDLEAKWVSHGIWSSDFPKLVPPLTHPEAHCDSKKSQRDLGIMFNGADFEDLRDKVIAAWPAFTITMTNPAASAYFNQAPILQFAPELKSFKQYLTKVVELSEKHDISGTLEGIEKGKNEISIEKFKEALKEAKPQLQCRRLSYGFMESQDEVKVLTKIGLCFTHDLKLKDCPNLGTCREKVYYLEDFERPE